MRAVELGVAEGEDATVGRHEPVPLAVGRRRHADHGLVQVQVARRAVELGVAAGEHPTVGADHPVPATIRRRRHAHDRRVQVEVLGSIEVGEVVVVAEPGQLARLAEQVVPVAGVGRHDVEGDGARDVDAVVRAVELDCDVLRWSGSRRRYVLVELRGRGGVRTVAARADAAVRAGGRHVQRRRTVNVRPACLQLADDQAECPPLGPTPCSERQAQGRRGPCVAVGGAAARLPRHWRTSRQFAVLVDRSVTMMLARVSGVTVEDGCAWPADDGAPDDDDPTLACGPKDPTAPAVVAALRASAVATVKNVANSTPPRRARPAAECVVFQ